MRRLTWGVNISISPTFRCNYDCEYCSMKLQNGKRKITSEVGIDEWLHLVDHFPFRLREVVISGGEPTLVSYFADLVNALLKRGKMVTIFTNLSNERLFDCTPSPRLRIAATFHPSPSVNFAQARKGLFLDRVRMLKGAGYQITVDEIGEKKLPISTDLKTKLTDGEQTKIYTMLRVAPDLSIYISCYDLFN